MMSDARMICPSDALADAAAAHQREPVYRFVFDHTYAGKLAQFGAGHGMDLYMVFHDLPPYITFDTDEDALSDQLVAAWSRFAHTGALDWPTAGSGTIETLDRALHAAPRRAACTSRAADTSPTVRGARSEASDTPAR
jgi:carboxylesterase type B